MAHSPIYRSNTRRRRAPLIPWRRTASLATAAAALTVSGIALGYHGFDTTIAPTTSASEVKSLAVAVPSISVAIADGGHPDVIGALSLALIARFQLVQTVVQGLSIVPVAQPLPFPIQPQIATEAFVFPVVIAPSSEPSDVTIEEEATAPDEPDEPVVAELSAAPLVARPVGAQPPAAVAPPAPEPVIEDAPPADPVVEPVAAIEPTPAPTEPPGAASAPVVHAQTSSPVHVTLPAVRQPTPVPAKAQPTADKEKQRQIQPPPPAAKQNKSRDNSKEDAEEHSKEDAEEHSKRDSKEGGDRSDKGKGESDHDD